VSYVTGDCLLLLLHLLLLLLLFLRLLFTVCMHR
jgi:hypothetical protein